MVASSATGRALEPKSGDPSCRSACVRARRAASNACGKSPMVRTSNHRIGGERQHYPSGLRGCAAHRALPSTILRRRSNYWPRRATPTGSTPGSCIRSPLLLPAPLTLTSDVVDAARDGSRPERREPDDAAVEPGVVLAAPARRRRLLQTSAVATIARDSALVRHQSQPRRLCAVACRVVFIAEC